MSSPEGKELLLSLLPSGETNATSGETAFFAPQEFMRLAGGFSALRFLTLMNSSMNPSLSKEQLLDINAKLNTIKKT